jgi:hypothetical protein
MMRKLWLWWTETWLMPRDDPSFGTFGTIMTRCEQGLVTVAAAVLIVSLLIVRIA